MPILIRRHRLPQFAVLHLSPETTTFLIFDPDMAPLVNFTRELEDNLSVSFFASLPLKVLGWNVTVWVFPDVFKSIKMLFTSTSRKLSVAKLETG
jgi:hypothetical protein